MKPERPLPPRTIHAPLAKLPPQTDWTRILYCDITGSCDARPFAWLLPRKEIDMNAFDMNRPAAQSRARTARHASGAGATRPHTDEGAQSGPVEPQLRSPLKQAALLLAIYVAMYGTVGLLVHVARALADDVAASILPPPGRDAAGPANDSGPAILACAPSSREPQCGRG